MVVEDLKPASVYIFQVKQSLKHEKIQIFRNSKITQISEIRGGKGTLQIFQCLYLDILRYRCEPGRRRATARSAGVLNSRPALTVSASDGAASITDGRCVFVCLIPPLLFLQ